MSKIVFTNGCFDLLHSGHIDLLEKAKKLGSKLIVGINSDSSVRKIKGKNRPILSQDERAAILIGLSSVDEVKIFDELTPEKMISEVKPDVLVKGGDWNKSEIVGADFVKRNGGEVHSIPLKEGHSSSGIVENILKGETANKKIGRGSEDETIAKRAIKDHLDIFGRLLTEQETNINDAAELVFEAIESGNKIMLCGNGGSAADAQHIAAELIGRYETDRKPLAAIALTTDTSALTALANDYSFENVFGRQVEGLANSEDVLIAISTSGNSPNVINAVMKARNIGCKVIGLTGEDGRKLAALCDACVMVPASRTSRIQEAHITIGHIWCEIIDKYFSA